MGSVDILASFLVLELFLKLKRGGLEVDASSGAEKAVEPKGKNDLTGGGRGRGGLGLVVSGKKSEATIRTTAERALEL